MNRHNTSRYIIGFLLFGSVWGLSEAALGDWLYASNVPGASVFLTVIALCILAAARAYLPFGWTGTSTGLIATLFKLVNMPFFACHLLAIVLLGAAFDMAYAAVPKLKRGTFRLAIVGIAANFLGRSLFAVLITWVFRYHFWTGPGLPKVIDYIFISGGISAVGCMIAVPAGHWLAASVLSHSWPKLHPRLSTISVLTAIAAVWLFQQALQSAG